MILEIDAATADAGVQTRLEAFLDIVRNHRAADAAAEGRSHRRASPATGRSSAPTGSRWR